MRIDTHCHVLGNGVDIDNVDNDVFLYAEDNQLLFTRMLAGMIEGELERMEGDLNKDGMISTFEYIEILYRMLKESEEIDGVALLALDALYEPATGALDRVKTDIWVSNKYLSRKVDELNARFKKEGVTGKKFYFGASVSPNRKDWESELDYVINQTEAVLVKLIPSSQHIHIRDKRHRDFYTMLAKNNMPLLCHVGPEYSFPEGIRNEKLDDFKYLKRPLECGVTVIAAHCASPVFPIVDPNVMKKYFKFMEKANSGGTVKLWADTSALSLSTRLPILSEILKTFPPRWLVHGTDFPIPIDGWIHLPLITPKVKIKEYIEICKTKNHLDKDVRIKRAHGFSDTIMENAEKVLRMPK